MAARKSVFRILPIGLTVSLAMGVALRANADEPPKAPPRSVYEVHAVTDGAIIGATALGSALTLAFANSLIYIPPSVNADQVNPVDRRVIGNRNIFLDNLSDATVVISLVAPVGLDLLDVGWTSTYAEDMTVYAETMSINSALISLFKFTVQRPLPRVYAGTDPQFTDAAKGYQSFYSGHVASTFAALAASSVTLGLRHDERVWPWVATALIGTSVAVERVAAGQHFYTDVGVGAIMGTAVGVLVPWLHKREAQGERHFSVAPSPDGVTVNWTKHL